MSAIIAQATQAGMDALTRKDRAQAAFAQLQAALGPGLTEEQEAMVDGIRLTPSLDE